MRDYTRDVIKEASDHVMEVLEFQIWNSFRARANSTVSGVTRSRNKYDRMRGNYCGQPFVDHYLLTD